MKIGIYLTANIYRELYLGYR